MASLFVLHATDTIIALSTPPGRSGIGLIRLSGKESLELTRLLLIDNDFEPEPNRVSLKPIHDPHSKEIIDRALITYFKSPHSYTGEDIIELSCHGSPPLLLQVIDSLLFLGARAADPGEFTMRALSNGRLNLTQAEAVRDLIDAQTYAAVRQAAKQLGGELSARLQPIKAALLDIIVPLESALEFVEDDLPEDIVHNLVQKLSSLSININNLADTFRRGRLLKDGLRVAFIGRPNVGKSSVFNGLLLSDRAIVTDVPGTTRDALSEVLNLQGVSVLITDTAGVRVSSDKIEQMGIDRTRRAIVDADLVIVVFDGSQPLTIEDKAILDEVSENRFIIALNKNDMESFSQIVPTWAARYPCISVSAKTGDGLTSLSAAIISPIAENYASDSSFVITSARHYDLLRRTVDSVIFAENLLFENVSEELVLAKLYDALSFLGQITGEATSEDVLSQIFSTFCIGK